LGRCFAKELALNGALIAAVDVNTKGLEELETETKNLKGKVFSIQLDVTHESSVVLFMNKISEEFGGINVLINNVGILRDGPLAKKEGGWTGLHKTPKDTTGLSRGVSCLLLNRIQSEGPDATGLPRGASRLLLFSFEREPPRHKAVASSPPNKKHRCSNQRDSPRDKPVASSTFCAKFASS